MKMCFRFDQNLLQWFRNLCFYAIDVKCKSNIQLFQIIYHIYDGTSFHTSDIVNCVFVSVFEKSIQIHTLSFVLTSQSDNKWLRTLSLL